MHTKSRTAALLILCAFTLLSGQQAPRRMTLRDATKLVSEIVRVHNAEATVNRTHDSYDPDFFYFEVIVPNRVASPVVGHFAVNPWTGDVWNPGLCELVTSPSLAKLQSKIRAKLQLSEVNYQKLRQRKPLCS